MLRLIDKGSLLSRVFASERYGNLFVIKYTPFYKFWLDASFPYNHRRRQLEYLYFINMWRNCEARETTVTEGKDTLEKGTKSVFCPVRKDCTILPQNYYLITNKMESQLHQPNCCFSKVIFSCLLVTVCSMQYRFQCGHLPSLHSSVPGKLSLVESVKKITQMCHCNPLKNSRTSSLMSSQAERKILQAKRWAGDGTGSRYTYITPIQHMSSIYRTLTLATMPSAQLNQTKMSKGFTV